MSVAFRVDASTGMGTGHLVRCLTLAEALRHRGMEPVFLTRAHPGHQIGLLQRRGMPVEILPPAPVERSGPSLGGYAGWLGATQEEDAQQTARVLRDRRPRWLVIDHYAIDASWESRLAGYAGQLLVIDDLANRSHACNLLLDQNYSTEGAQRYRGLLSSECAVLSGPRYALLRAEYAESRRSTIRRNGRVRRVLIFFGGSDPANVTGKALEALTAPDLADLHVDVVIGANNPHRAALEHAIASRPSTTAHGPRDHLADLMAQADLAIGAGGTTTWERMCLGLFSIVIGIAQNQVPACEALSKAGLIHYLGMHDGIRPQDLADAVRASRRAPERLLDLSLRNQLVVDGLGTDRVVERMVPSSVSELRLRKAREEDLLLYFEWANDPEVRRQALRCDPIDLADHQRWFFAKLAAPATEMFVLLAGNLPVGQIRFDLDDAGAWIDYSIDGAFRGRGWARRLVTLGIEQLRARAPIAFCAEVKDSNPASMAVFRGLGFVESGPRTVEGCALWSYRLECGDITR